MNKNVLRQLSYGMYAVSTLDNERDVGCIANSIIQITYDTVAISMNHKNFTNECLNKHKKLVISILGEDIENDIIAYLGYQSGRNKNKFENIECFKIDNINVIKSAIGYLTCNIIDKIETETHTVFIAQIIDGDIIKNSVKPMNYAYYQENRRGKSPENAPTFISNLI